MAELWLIGERLNSHRSPVQKAVAERDAEALLAELQRQVDAGVTHVDVHAGASGPLKERADALWMLETILPALPARTGICLDSSSTDVLDALLSAAGARPGTILNGVTNDGERLWRTLPLVKRSGAAVVAVLSAGQKPPQSVAQRLEWAGELRARLCDAGIPDERQIFDPQVLPLASDTQQPVAALDALRELRARWPGVRLLAGVSNVSFNLPQRRRLNRSYAAMLLAAGCDTLLCDPCDGELRAVLAASRALLGQDDFLTDYLASVQ